ncbi:MAG TPA: low affinity iron permease family protein [Methyloceanibacter sp.]|nr:low affinity iron permease family protein [Methyloceanibacter sp.]
MRATTSWFTHFAQLASRMTGRPIASFIAIAAIVLWAVSGPLFGYSDTWQLVINTSTTIITFLMVFIIQNTQNRDTAAMHIKMDELIRVTPKARNILLDLEELDDKDLEAVRQDYERLAEAGRTKAHKRSPRAAARPKAPAASKGRKQRGRSKAN